MANNTDNTSTRYYSLASDTCLGKLIFLNLIEINANRVFASIDIQWVQPIECQCWQDPARNWQEISNYAETRINILTFQTSFTSQ